MPRMSLLLPLALAIPLGLAACSSTPDAPPASLPAARAALQGVDPSLANRYAPAEYREATTLLDQAEAAWRDEEYDRARRLSEQSLTTTRLTQARTQAAQAEEARTDVARTLQTLESEVGLSSPRRQGPAPGTLAQPGTSVPATQAPTTIVPGTATAPAGTPLPPPAATTDPTLSGTGAATLPPAGRGY